MRWTHYLLPTAIIGIIVGGPWAYANHRRTHQRNFREVRPSLVYRSGQMTLAGLKAAIRDHGIKTVITLRDAAVAGEDPPDMAEEAYCKIQNIGYVRISPRRWWAPDGSAPAQKGVEEFLRVMDDPNNFPVLIHCFAGIHRTGAFCAIYRMEYQGWSNAEAIAEMRRCGYKDLEDEWDLLGFLQGYQPRHRR